MINNSTKIFLIPFCSINENQKPISEYLSLKENFLFQLSKNYLKNYFFSFFFIFFIIFFSKFFQNHFVDFFLISLILSFISILLYSWIQTFKKFSLSFIFYEESSWFDSEIWQKSFYCIKKDKLIQSQKIFPIIKKLISNFYLYFFLFFILK